VQNRVPYRNLTSIRQRWLNGETIRNVPALLLTECDVLLGVLEATPENTNQNHTFDLLLE
jgi:hypothetical protein